MAGLYLDNDVSLHLAPLLRVAGHAVAATRDRNLRRAPDDAQLLTAALNRWILVTCNRLDFTMLHDAWLTWPAAFGVALPPHPGILILDVAPLEAQANAVGRLFAHVDQGFLPNGLFWWSRVSGWRRRVIGRGWEPYPPV